MDIYSCLEAFQTAFMYTTVRGNASARGWRMKRAKLSSHFESIMTWQPVVKATQFIGTLCKARKKKEKKKRLMRR
jgi:hypothetical protein